ncbi:hypothetical protein BVX98_07580, partial [bacterium F11]
MNQTLLIVDDEEWSCRILKEYFQEHNLKVDYRLTIRDALTYIKTNEKPDVILLDIGLPDGNGLDLLKALRGTPRTKSIPVIIVTGHLKYTPHKVRGLKMGADDYIVKPFNLDELEARIHALIRRSKTPMSPSPQPEQPPTPQKGAEPPHSSAGRVSEILSDIISKKDPKKEPVKSSPVTPPTPKKPTLIQPSSLKPSPLHTNKESLFHAIVDLFLEPSKFFRGDTLHMGTRLLPIFLGTFSVGMGFQGGLQHHSLTYGLISAIAYFIGGTILTSLLAWLIQWTLGLKQKYVAFKNLLIAIGLGWAPMALNSFLGFLYVLLAHGQKGDFTAGPQLLFPMQGTGSFIGFLFRHLDAFEIWSVFLVAISLVSLVGFNRKRT